MSDTNYTCVFGLAFSLMNKIVVRRSTKAWLIATIISCLMMTVELIHPSYHLNPVMCITTFVFVGAAVQLLLVKPRVLIDDEGITLLVYQRKFLWQDIQNAEFQSGHRSGDKITLLFHNHKRLPFTLFGVDTSPTEVYFEIQQRIRKYGRHADEPAEVGVDDDDAELS